MVPKRPVRQEPMYKGNRPSALKNSPVQMKMIDTRQKQSEPKGVVEPINSNVARPEEEEKLPAS